MKFNELVKSKGLTKDFSADVPVPAYFEETRVTDHDLVDLLIRCAVKESFENAEVEIAQVTAIDHFRSPQPYEGLIGRHRMGVYVETASGLWWVSLVISRLPLERGDKTSKRQASREDLEFLLQSPIEDFCNDFGILEIGEKKHLLGAEDRNRNHLVATFPAGNTVAAVGLYCLTRPLALYRGLT